MLGAQTGVRLLWEMLIQLVIQRAFHLSPHTLLTLFILYLRSLSITFSLSRVFVGPGHPQCLEQLLAPTDALNSGIISGQKELEATVFTEEVEGCLERAGGRDSIAKGLEADVSHPSQGPPQPPQGALCHII